MQRFEIKFSNNHNIPDTLFFLEYNYNVAHNAYTLQSDILTNYIYTAKKLINNNMFNHILIAMTANLIGFLAASIRTIL